MFTQMHTARRNELERPWTTSSATYGGFERLSSRSPFKAHPMVFEPPPSSAKKHGPNFATTAEDFGSFYSERVQPFKPLVRPRPASDVSIQLRNNAIRLGMTSSEAVGTHTGVAPRRELVAGFRPVPQSLAARAGVRPGEVIGIHPPPPPLDPSNAAACHTEANFALRFPWHRSSRSSDARSALGFQSSWLQRAEALDAANRLNAPGPAGGNGNLVKDHAGRGGPQVGSQTTMPLGSCTPNLDPRVDIVRPPGMPYGGVDGHPQHRVSTSHGERTMLPTRSFMAIDGGVQQASLAKTRALDF